MENAKIIARKIYREFKSLDSANETTYSFEYTEDSFVKAFEAKLVNTIAKRNIVNTIDGMSDVDKRNFNEVYKVDSYRFGGVMSDTGSSTKDAAKTLFNVVNKGVMFVSNTETLITNTLKTFEVPEVIKVVSLFNAFSQSDIEEILKRVGRGAIDSPINIGGGDQSLFTKEDSTMYKCAKNLDTYIDEDTEIMHWQPILLPADIEKDVNSASCLLVMYDELLKGGYEINAFEERIITQRRNLISRELTNFMYLVEARENSKFVVVKRINSTIYITRRMIDEMNNKYSGIEGYSVRDVLLGAYDLKTISNLKTEGLTEDNVIRLISIGNTAMYNAKKEVISEVSRTLAKELINTNLINRDSSVKYSIPYHIIEEEVTKRLNGSYEANGENIIIELSKEYGQSVEIFTRTVVEAINTFSMKRKDAILVAIASILAIVASREIVVIEK